VQRSSPVPTCGSPAQTISTGGRCQAGHVAARRGCAGDRELRHAPRRRAQQLEELAYLMLQVARCADASTLQPHYQLERTTPSSVKCYGESDSASRRTLAFVVRTPPGTRGYYSQGGSVDHERCSIREDRCVFKRARPPEVPSWWMAGPLAAQRADQPRGKRRRRKYARGDMKIGTNSVSSTPGDVEVKSGDGVATSCSVHVASTALQRQRREALLLRAALRRAMLLRVCPVGLEVFRGWAADSAATAAVTPG
jgi:hypothetical protein